MIKQPLPFDNVSFDARSKEDRSLIRESIKEHTITSTAIETGPKIFGKTTLSDGRVIYAREPSTGVVIDRMTTKGVDISMLTIPAIAVGLSEEEIRSMPLSDGAAIIAMCAPLRETLQQLFGGQNGQAVSTAQ